MRWLRGHGRAAIRSGTGRTPAAPAEQGRPPGPLRPPDPAAMVDGAAVDGGVVRVESFGHLTLTGPELIVCDPFDFRVAPPAQRLALTPGDHEVTGLVIDDGAGGRTVVAARLVVTGEAVERREPGPVGEQDPTTLGPGRFFGFGVDAGVACFADAAAVAAALAAVGVDDLVAWRGLPGSMAERPETASRLLDRVARLFDELDDGVVELIDRSPGAGVRYALPGGRPGGVVAFPAGYGDGAYPVWVGYSRDGRVADVLADFLVLPRSG